MKKHEQQTARFEKNKKNQMKLLGLRNCYKNSFLILIVLSLLFTLSNVLFSQGLEKKISIENEQETEYFIPNKSTSRERSLENPADGKYSLKVVFNKFEKGSTHPYPGVNFYISKAGLPMDFSQYTSFSLNVYNPMDTDIVLEINIWDDKKGASPVFCNVGKGVLKAGKMNQLILKLDGIEKKINRESIKRIEFLIAKPEREVTLYFDNFLLSKIIQSDMGDSQKDKLGVNNLLFFENFENSPNKPLFKKWMSGAVEDEKIEIVTSDVFSGKQCIKISFTPTDGKYWYYLLGVDIVQEANTDYVAEAALKAYSNGNINVKLYTTSSSYQDGEYKKLKADGYMESLGSLSNKNIWENVRSAPYNKIKMLKNVGKDEPYVKFRGVIIAVDSAKIGVPITIFVDDISIRKVDNTEKTKFFNELQKKYSYIPKDYPIQTERFYYGFWSHGLGAGYYDWNQYKELQSKKDRYLCTIEKMIECNSDTMMSETYYPSQDMARIDDIIESAAIAHTYGLATIAQTYLTPYYKKDKTLADCQKSIDIVIPKLKAAKGIVSYYHIDEPQPDEHSLEYWIWGKKAINSIDPEKPVTGVRNTISTVVYYGYTERVHLLDIYPLKPQGGGKKTYDMEGGSPLVIESFCAAAYLAGAKDLWIFNQAFFTAYPAQFRMPSAAEIRMMTYISLAFGSKGLFYFSFLTPLATTTAGHEKTIGIYNDVYAPQYDFGKEVIRLGNIVPIYAPVLVGTSHVKDAGFLVEADTIAVESENKKGIGFGYNQGNAYGVLVCYNRCANSLQEGKIKFPDDIIKGKKVFDLLKLREIKLINNSLSLSFTAGDGAIFVIATEKDFATIAQECGMRRFYSIKRRFDFYAREAINAGISVADEIKSTENSLEILKTDSLVAVTQISDAYDLLNKKMESHPVHSSVKKHLRNIQDNYSAILTLYWPYIIDNWGVISLNKDKKWLLWTKQMTMISEIYILIRNGLYAGKLNETIAIAEDADALSSAMKAACGVNNFEPVEDDKINNVYNQARKNFSGIGMTVLKNRETKSRG